MKWQFSDGWNLDDFSRSISMSADAELSADEKAPFVAFT